jgi:GntR family transcriptional regulator, rspAB operon transcriptional repressor
MTFADPEGIVPMGSGSTGTRIFHRLREAIVRVKIEPGQALSEAEIAKVYSVSRQPVREAFIKLAGAGLVEVRPQRGTYVSRIAVADVLNGRFLREAIEVAVVREAAINASPAAVRTLRSNLAQQRRIQAGDHAGFLALDYAFHEDLARAIDREQIQEWTEVLRTQMDRVRYLSLGAATPIARLVEQHTRIADCIADHDPEAAAAAMREHLREVLQSLPALVAKFPDMFELPDQPHPEWNGPPGATERPSSNPARRGTRRS